MNLHKRISHASIKYVECTLISLIQTFSINKYVSVQRLLTNNIQKFVIPEAASDLKFYKNEVENTSERTTFLKWL